MNPGLWILALGALLIVWLKPGQKKTISVGRLESITEESTDPESVLAAVKSMTEKNADSLLLKAREQTAGVLIMQLTPTADQFGWRTATLTNGWEVPEWVARYVLQLEDL